MKASFKNIFLIQKGLEVFLVHFVKFYANKMQNHAGKKREGKYN